MTLALRSDAGVCLGLEAARWKGELTNAEQRLLRTVEAPVLDVGCGPGRFVAALARLGMPSLGIEPVGTAAALARRRGGAVLQRSVFEPLPATGRWRSVMLLDGNVGIGGDPVRLLARCRDLIAVDGSVIVEVGPPGQPTGTYRVRLERADGHGPWFHWSVVGADAIATVTSSAGLKLERLDADRDEHRWFAFLAHRRG